MMCGGDIRRRCEATVMPMVREFDDVKGRLFEIAEQVYPMAKRTITDEVDEVWKVGERHLDDKVLNTVPYEALRKGSAGFFVNLTNPAQKWFRLEDGMAAGDVGDIGQGSRSEYLEMLENHVFRVMAKSGSYRAFKKGFEHLLAFGFCCILVKEVKGLCAKAECLPIGTYAFGIGSDGSVNRVNRRFAMTAEEIVHEFGAGADGTDSLPPDVVAAWRRGNNGKDGNYIVECLIEPNETAFKCGTMEPLDYGVSKSMAYRSIYWLRGRSGLGDGARGGYPGILCTRGYRFNPIIAPRFDVELGGIYGRGRGHDALNSCRALQALTYDQLEISSNRAEPPLLAANELREEGLDLSRGAVTYTNLGEQRSDLVLPILTNPPTSDETQKAATAFEQRIKELFFLGEFATIDSLKMVNPGDKRTAAEVNALKSENMLQLGGIVLNLESEMLDPIVTTFINYVSRDRGFRSTVGGGSIPNGEIVPEYIGNLQMAQKTHELNSSENSVNFAMAIAANGIKLGVKDAAAVMDNYDFDRIVRTRHKIVGASDTQMRNMDDIEAIRRQREQAEQAKAQIEAQKAQSEIMLQQAKAASNVGRASEAIDPSGFGGVAASMGGIA